MLVKALNYWSAPGGLKGTLSPLDFIDLAHEHRFAAAELAIGDAGSALGIDATDALCETIRAHADARGVQLLSTASGLYWTRNLADAEESQRKQAQSDLASMLRISAKLGAKTHLTIPGAVDVFFLPERTPLAYSHVWHFATEGIRAVLPVAEEVRVRIGIENVWNRFLMSPVEMAMFLDQFASPFVGAYFDVANVLPFGYPEDWIRHLGNRVVGVHLKDYRRSVGTAEGFVDLLEGDVNWPEVVAALREIRYEGPVAAEMIPLYRHHPETRIANASRAMDAILG